MYERGAGQECTDMLRPGNTSQPHVHDSSGWNKCCCVADWSHSGQFWTQGLWNHWKLLAIDWSAVLRICVAIALRRIRTWLSIPCAWRTIHIHLVLPTFQYFPQTLRTYPCTPHRCIRLLQCRFPRLSHNLPVE